MGKAFRYRCYTGPRHLKWCSNLKRLLLPMLFGYLHGVKTVRRNIWSSKWNAPTKSKFRKEPCTDVCMPISPAELHPLEYSIWSSNASTTTVAFYRITLASGSYWMWSNKKGVLTVPEATTTKFLGVSLSAKPFNEQISTLFRLTLREILFEGKAFPSR